MQINLFRAAIAGPRVAKTVNLPLMKVMLGMLAQPENIMKLAHMATAFDKIQAATEKGDLDFGVQLLGECTGIIHDIPTVKEVIDRTIKEAKAAQKRIGTMIG